MIFVGIHLERDYGPFWCVHLLFEIVLRLLPLVLCLDYLDLCFLVFFGTGKFTQCAALAVLFTINFLLGLLPYIDNFANIGAFISELLLGFVLLFTPQVRQMSKNKAGLFECGVKSSIKFKLKLDRPVLRLVGCLVAVLRGIDINHYCGWCRFVDCIPCKRWKCNDSTNACEIMKRNLELTLTCLHNGHFRVFPFTNISQARITDLCSMIC